MLKGRATTSDGLDARFEIVTLEVPRDEARRFIAIETWLEVPGADDPDNPDHYYLGTEPGGVVDADNPDVLASELFQLVPAGPAEWGPYQGDQWRRRGGLHRERVWRPRPLRGH